MPHEVADRFIAALHEAERSKDPEPLVTLFTEDAELRSIPHLSPDLGLDGARAFWTAYLDLFERIESRFTSMVVQDRFVVLEWESDGALRNGRPLRYSGVTVLEIEDSAVRRLRTYYDPRPFVAPVAIHATEAHA